MRQALVVGNWKMHGSRASVIALLDGLVGDAPDPKVAVAVCPAYVHLSQALDLCTGSSVAVGAQDCSHMTSGAYTGERRQYHSESDDLVAAKLTAAVRAGLCPIVCVGEAREERENGEAQSVVARQLKGALQVQTDLTGLVIAYEPVWAIGTGLTATPAEAQQMHAFIREQLAEVSAKMAAQTRVLYGGSVKPGNADELFAQPDIDGALVGGAALVAEDFQAIVAAAAAS